MPDAIYHAGDFSSQARFLFDRFAGPDGLANVRALVGQRPKVTETNWLEFKSGQVQAEDIKRLWSKALGSFANSGGGVVIWGILASRDKATGIDAVQKEDPVPDVDKLVSKLKEYQPPATDPPIRGVELKALLLPGAVSEGFVVCFIPESDAKPHRSEFGERDVKRFHLRIGDTTQECTVPILRQLFYPQYSPKLEVTLELRSINEAQTIALITNPTKDVALVKFSLRNVGMVSTYDIFADARCGPHTVYKDGLSGILAPMTCQRISDVLHPSLDTGLSFLVYGHQFALVRLDWEITVYARDMLPKRAAIPHATLLQTYNVPHTAPCV